MSRYIARLVLAVLLVPVAMGAEKEVRLPHLSTASGTLTGIKVEHDQKLTFIIDDTYPECFTYNLKEKVDTSALEAAGPQLGEVRLTTEHDEEVTAYEIVIAARPSADPGCPAGARTFTIPVRPYWHLAATGGFAHDELKDPAYFLEPGSKTENGATTQGFHIREDADAEDAYNIGGTTLIHLYSNTSAPVAWAPLSFGLGLNNNETRYLIGTTVRFGPLVYVTAGAAFGERNRLPTGTHVNDFTTNANLLSTMTDRRDQGAFVAISFKFLEQGLQPFKNAVVGKPVLDTPPPPPPVPAEPSIAATSAAERKAGEPLIITGINFGEAATTSAVVFSGTPPVEINGKDANVTSWAKDKIEIKVPDLLKQGEAEREVEVSVKVSGKESLTKKKLKVKR